MFTFTRLFSLTLLSLFAMTAQAVSFDCQKASNFVEKAICQNPTLSALDDELATVFQQALDNSKNPDSLKKQEVTWLKTKRDTCQTTACVEKAYKNRIAALNKFIDKATAEIGD
jgi:uncharacterized protein